MEAAHNAAWAAGRGDRLVSQVGQDAARGARRDSVSAPPCLDPKARDDTSGLARHTALLRASRGAGRRGGESPR